MTRILASLILALAVVAVTYISTIRPNRHPMMIDAKAKIAEPNMLFAPCPLTLQNLPPRREPYV